MQAVAQMQALARTPVAVHRPQQPRCRAVVSSRVIVRPRTFLMARCAQPTVRPPLCCTDNSYLICTDSRHEHAVRGSSCVAADGSGFGSVCTIRTFSTVAAVCLGEGHT